MWATLAMGPARKLGLLSGEGAQRRLLLLLPAEKASGPQQTLPLYAGKGPGPAWQGHEVGLTS